jgi:hypothetical protein
MPVLPYTEAPLFETAMGYRALHADDTTPGPGRRRLGVTHVVSFVRTAVNDVLPYSMHVSGRGTSCASATAPSAPSLAYSCC